MTSMRCTALLFLLAACSGTKTEPQAADGAPEAPDACSPLLDEVCGNGVDETCNGQADEGCPVSGSHLWAVAMGGPSGEDITTAVVATPESGVIALLQHDGIATFGKGQANETSLTAPHPSQQLLSAGRYDSTGALVWARRLALNTTLQDGLKSSNMLYTSDDGLIIAGDFEGDVSIGPDTVNPIELNTSGQRHGFAARYAADGEVQWAQQLSGAGTSLVRSIAQLSDGRVAIAGWAMGSVIFDAGGLAEQVLPEDGTTQHAFVAWFTADGVFEQAAHITGDPNVHMKIAAGDNGTTLLVMGNRSAGGRVEVNSESTAVTDTSGIFLCRFATNGAVTDLTMVAEGNMIELHGMARDASGSLYLTGTFHTSALFAPGRSSETLVETPNWGMFVVHLDSNLDVSWLRSFSETHSKSFAVAADPASPGGVIVGGFVSGETVFGEGEAGATTLLPIGSRGLFVARYEADGNVNWVRSVSTWGSYNITYALALRSDGAVVAAGQIGSSTIFGEGQDNESSLEVEHTSQGFLAVFGL